jgi:DNA adenine methylase
MRPPVKWHGGKYYLAPWIIEHFPAHRIYVETHGGAASVLLAKPPSPVEIYNDLDERINRLFRVLRDEGAEFQRILSLTPYSRFEFNEAGNDDLLEPAPADSDALIAVRDFIRWRQSFGGQGKSWSFTTSRTRGGIADVVNGWWTAIEGLPEVIGRLQQVQFEHCDALELFPRYDSAETLFYCDPPYVHAARSSTDVYGVEMSDDDHRRLAEAAKAAVGKIVLSGYRCDLYDSLFGDWRRVEKTIANHAAGGTSKARMTECLWMNF